MNICILTPRFPFPENGGDVLRINHIAQFLKSQGNKLILVSYCEKNSDIESAKKLYDSIFVIKRHSYKSFFYSLLFLLKGLPIQCGYYYSNSYKRLLKKVIRKEKPQRYIVHLLRMVPFIDEDNVISTTVEMTDALSKTYELSNKSKGFSIKKFIYHIEKSLIAKYEKKIIRKFPKVILVSSEDINYLNVSLGYQAKSLELHTNGVEYSRNISKCYNPNKICFIGNMRTLQNQDAVLFFCKEIFPLILLQNKGAVFYIIGAEPPQKIKDLAINNKNIIVTGFVNDLESIAKDSCLAVAPVNIAAGIQNKVLMAMGMGLPVILTSLISKAIPELKDGINCYIEDEPSRFALKCLELMSNPNKRNQIADEGYRCVKENYSWSHKLEGY